jgi:hypothetical protein
MIRVLFGAGTAAAANGITADVDVLLDAGAAGSAGDDFTINLTLNEGAATGEGFSAGLDESLALSIAGGEVTASVEIAGADETVTVTFSSGQAPGGGINLSVDVALEPGIALVEGYDIDSTSWFTAVAAADDEELSNELKDAVDAFVVGTKADGTWDKIESLGFLAGPKTLAGALVPVKGTAPTNVGFRENIDSDYENVTLLMRMNGPSGSTTSFIDEGIFRAPFASSAGALSTAEFKYGRSAYDITTSSQFLSFANRSYYHVTTGEPFTVEAWVYNRESAGRVQYIMRHQHTTGFNDGGWQLAISQVSNEENTFFFSYGTGSGTVGATVVATPPTYSINTWHHVAACFDGTTLRVFQDGVLVRESAASGIGAPANSSLFIGRDPSNASTRWWNGYIDSIRITRGVARYTTAFTPPTEEFGGGQSDHYQFAGLRSNGNDQYLNSNRAGNADPQDDFSMVVYASSKHQIKAGFGAYIGGGGTGTGARNIFRNFSSPNYVGHNSRNTTTTSSSFQSEPASNRFIGSSRGASGSYISRAGGTNTTISVASQTPTTDDLLVFARGSGSNVDQGHANTRLSMYAIGKDLDLADLDTRATTLFNAIWKPLPQVIGTFIDSGFDSSIHVNTARTLDVPTHVENDLLIAVLMWRDDMGVLTPPAGWKRHGAYMDQIVFSGVRQHLHVYTKQASSSEPASYTWSASSGTTVRGMMVSVRGGAIDTVSEGYGNGTTATIDTLPDRLNLTAFTWVFASTSSESYSQSGASVTQITDSPKANARLSGGYTTTQGTITSTHDSTDTTFNPNHGGINIQIMGA